MDALAIEERLNRLEKENKRLMTLIEAMVTMVAPGGDLPPAAATGVRAWPPRLGRTVEAERFVLRDASGKPRAAKGYSGAFFGRLRLLGLGRLLATDNRRDDENAFLAFLHETSELVPSVKACHVGSGLERDRENRRKEPMPKNKTEMPRLPDSTRSGRFFALDSIRISKITRSSAPC
jgi:hypothetical protein